jgi:predicted porin
MGQIGKKQVILAAAAGVFLAPATLFAQSSVTISGRLTMEFSDIKISGKPGRNSEAALSDNTSYLRFNVNEDLGGGLQAIGQLETRNQLDSGTLAASGTSFVGLRSKSWGTVTFGRQNLHYFHRESNMFAKGGSLRGDSMGILAYANGGATSIANATRTPNVVQWNSPKWGGLTVDAAYSSNPGGVEADTGSTSRKGRAWNLNPNYKAANFQVGYSYWDGKSDGAFAGLGAPALLGGAQFGTPAGIDQRGHRLYGSYKWGGFKAGLAIDDARLRTVTALATTEISRRTAWSVPLEYTTGPHGIYAEFSKANRDRAAPFAGLDTKANLFSLTYLYSLSKRTAVGVNYARLNNGSAAFYNLYTSRVGTTDPLGVASTGGNPNAGEDPRIIGASISHYF